MFVCSIPWGSRVREARWVLLFALRRARRAINPPGALKPGWMLRWIDRMRHWDFWGQVPLIPLFPPLSSPGSFAGVQKVVSEVCVFADVLMEPTSCGSSLCWVWNRLRGAGHPFLFGKLG